MSHFFPTSPYAEDQPLPTIILTTHVLYRGFQTGALFGPITRSAIFLFKRHPLTSPALLRATATGGIIGTVLSGVALVGRMWGREEIEWKDRSWALMRNRGQAEVDDWSQVGVVGGGVWGALTGRRIGLGWRGPVAGAGLGSLLGVVGCMVWGRIRGVQEEGAISG
ncbi:hypothetical protein BJX70DRAFT_400972 [Aspergillus crustosus]